MFFGTMHWLILLSAYYLAYDATSRAHRMHHVNVRLVELEQSKLEDSLMKRPGDLA